MNEKEITSKWKIHLTFIGGFCIAFASAIALNVAADQPFLTASLNALRDIRPMDCALFVLFWYMCAADRPKDAWGSSLTILNLGRSNK